MGTHLIHEYQPTHPDQSPYAVPSAGVFWRPQGTNKAAKDVEYILPDECQVHDTILKHYGTVEAYLRETCGIDQDTLRSSRTDSLRKPITLRAAPWGARAAPHRPRRAR